MANKIVWANIPVDDIERAKRFYSELLGVEMEDLPDYGGAVAVPSGGEPGEVAFNLLQGADFKPTPDGVRIVFNAGDEIDAMVARVEPAGGKVMQQPEQMGPIGIFAQVMDSEGNMISLMATSPE